MRFRFVETLSGGKVAVMDAIPISQVMGTNVRRIRTEIAHASQSDVTVQLLDFGVSWSPGRVALIESGEGAATVTTLLLLAYALDRLTPEDVTVRVTDLLRTPAGEPLELAPRIEVPSEVLLDVLGGADPTVVGTYRGSWESTAEGSAPSPALPPGVDPREAEMYARYTQTDVRAARTLGLTRTELIQFALGLWGRNLSAERDRRATEAGITSSGRKIAITSNLLDEVRLELDVDRAARAAEAREEDGE